MPYVLNTYLLTYLHTYLLTICAGSASPRLNDSFLFQALCSKPSKNLKFAGNFLVNPADRQTVEGEHITPLGLAEVSILDKPTGTEVIWALVV